MPSDICGSRLLLALPDDIFPVITSSLSPRDVCSLGITCPGLNDAVSSDKVWFAQCNKLGILLPLSTLIEWRNGVSSYKALCRFLVNIHPLMGIWVDKHPKFGNVVYVMPGFLSVVGCRIIHEKIGPLDLENGPIMWRPVFEIICKYDGSTAFFLHGKERGAEYVYPGFIKSVDRNCNVLLLEVEPTDQRDEIDKDVPQKMWTERPFVHLCSGDRQKLLGFVTSQVRDIVPDAVNVLLFPRSRHNEVDSEQDFAVLRERRLLLLQMYNRFNTNHDLKSIEFLKSLQHHASQTGERDRHHRIKGKTLFGFLKNGLKQLLRQSRSTNCDRKYVTPLEFLGSNFKLGLSLRAESMELRRFKAWPYMHGSPSALYKLPNRAPKASHEYAGLWGGTFGWPPSSDKPGKALFCILISYEESKHMIGTKILEGTSYVGLRNESVMFAVNTDQPSVDIFPWDTEEESNPISDVKQSFKGEGISCSGYKPGSLFVLENGLLVFFWEESREVLTLKRLDLWELLRKGERVHSLSPVFNFVHHRYTNWVNRINPPCVL